MNKGNEDKLKEHYSYFQNLITQSVTGLFVYNQLFARAVYTKNFKKIRLNMKDAIISKEENQLEDLELEMVMTLLVTTCHECTRLSEVNKNYILVGDLLFCERTPESCKFDDMVKTYTDDVVEQEKSQSAK